MAYSETLADRVRARLGPKTIERKMFGGLTFMVNGHMCCGVEGDRLMVRLAPDAAAHALSDPQVTPFDATGKPMKGMVWGAPDAIRTPRDLNRWVDRAARHASSLPRKY